MKTKKMLVMMLFFILPYTLYVNNECFITIEAPKLDQTIFNISRQSAGLLVTFIGGIVAYQTVHPSNTYSIYNKSSQVSQPHTNTININSNPVTYLDWFKFGFGAIFSSICVPLGLYLTLTTKKFIN